LCYRDNQVGHTLFYASIRHMFIDVWLTRHSVSPRCNLLPKCTKHRRYFVYTIWTRTAAWRWYTLHVRIRSIWQHNHNAYGVKLMYEVSLRVVKGENKKINARTYILGWIETLERRDIVDSEMYFARIKFVVILGLTTASVLRLQDVTGCLTEIQPGTRVWPSVTRVDGLNPLGEPLADLADGCCSGTNPFSATGASFKGETSRSNLVVALASGWLSPTSTATLSSNKSFSTGVASALSLLQSFQLLWWSQPVQLFLFLC